MLSSSVALLVSQTVSRVQLIPRVLTLYGTCGEIKRRVVLSSIFRAIWVGFSFSEKQTYCIEALQGWSVQGHCVCWDQLDNKAELIFHTFSKPSASQSPGCFCQSTKQGKKHCLYPANETCLVWKPPRSSKCALCRVMFESWAHPKVAEDRDCHLSFCWVHGLLTHRKVQRTEKAHSDLLGWKASSSHPSGLRRGQGVISSSGNSTGAGTFTVSQIQLQSCQGSAFSDLGWTSLEFDLKRFMFLWWQDKLNAF